jgi:integrase
MIDLMDSLSERSKSTANHTFSSLSTMMNFALRRSDIDKNPLAGLNKHKIEKRQRVLSDCELLRIWEAAEDMGFPEGVAIQMLILTGQRKNEVAQANWQEFDLSSYTWTLPPQRTKNKRTHIIPITERMLGFFDKHWPAETRHGPLFPAQRGKPINSFAAMKTRLDAYAARRVELARATLPPGTGQTIEHFVFHDLRRTVATGMAILGVPVNHTEAILNHRDGARSQLVETYQVYDLVPEKQVALANWHKHLEGLIHGDDAWPGGKELPPLIVPTRKPK